MPPATRRHGASRAWGGCPAAGFGPAGSARPAENAGAGRLAGTPGGSIDAFGAFRRASRLTAIDCGISSRISTEPCGRDGGRAAKCKRRAGTFPARRAATGIARIGTEACDAHGLAVVRGNCARPRFAKRRSLGARRLANQRLHPRGERARGGRHKGRARGMGRGEFLILMCRKEHDAALGLYGDQPAHGLSNQGNARCRDAASVRANDAPCSAPRNVCSQARSWRGQARTRSLG